MSDDGKDKPSYEDLLSKVMEQERTIFEKDGIIGQYQTTIDDLNKGIEEREARINRLQGIIADNIPTGKGEPPATTGNSKKSFADMYHEMITKNVSMKGGQ